MSTTTIVPSICVTQKIGCRIHHDILFNQTDLPDGSIRIDLQDNADKTLVEQGDATLACQPLFPDGESLLRRWIHLKKLPPPCTMASIIDAQSRGITYTGSRLSHLPEYKWKASIMLETDPFYPKDPPNPTQSIFSLCVPSIELSGHIKEDSTCKGSLDSVKGN